MVGDEKKTDGWTLPSAPEPVKNIVLVGRTGNGKSATANSIIGRRVFESTNRAIGVTKECQTYRVPTTPIINVIDTPGLFDMSESTEFISKEIINCLALAEGGLHAVVLVLSLSGRISAEEESTLRTLQMLFGSKILDYLIVLFTCGDVLEYENMTLDEYLSQGYPEFLKVALRLCGGRKVLFDNRTKDEDKKAQQIQDLLVHIATIETSNGGNPFTDKMHRKIQEEAERVRRQEKEIEERNIAEVEKAHLKKQLQMSYSQNMNMMAQMMERMLKDAAAAHERQMEMLKTFMDMSIKDKDDKLKRAKAKREKQRAQSEAGSEDSGGDGGGCNIL